MVGVCAGNRWSRFCHIEPVHLRIAGLDHAPCVSEVPRMRYCRRVQVEKIGVERDNDFSFPKIVNRFVSRKLSTNRIPFTPFRVRKLFRDRFQLRGKCG